MNDMLAFCSFTSLVKGLIRCVTIFNPYKSLLAEVVDFRIIWKKNTFNVTFPLDESVPKLKEHIHTLTGMREFCHSCFKSVAKNNTPLSHYTKKISKDVI